jgi:hypothetical protein
MQQGIAWKQQIRAEASASFPVAPREVIILTNLHRKSTQRHVAVSSAVKSPVLAKTLPIASQLGSDATYLVEFREAIPDIENLLHRDNIGIQLYNDFRDSLRTGTAVQTFAFVNIVSGNPEAKAHCSRSKTQPIISNSRSDKGRLSQS